MTLSDHIRAIARLLYEHPSSSEAQVRVMRSESDVEGRAPKLSFYPATAEREAVVLIDPECEELVRVAGHMQLEGTGPNATK